MRQRASCEQPGGVDGREAGKSVCCKIIHIYVLRLLGRSCRKRLETILRYEQEDVNQVIPRTQFVKGDLGSEWVERDI